MLCRGQKCARSPSKKCHCSLQLKWTVATLSRFHCITVTTNVSVCKHRNQVVIGPSHSIDLNSVLSSVNASTKTQCVACTTGKLFCPQLSATTGYAESQATPCMPDVDNQTCMPNMLRSTREFLYSKLAPTRLSNIP